MKEIRARLHLSEALEAAIRALAERDRREFNSEIVWILEQYIKQERMKRMQFDSRSNEYVGQLPDGSEVRVDADVYAEQEQAGVSEQDLNSPLVWENNQDGESVRVVK